MWLITNHMQIRNALFHFIFISILLIYFMIEMGEVHFEKFHFGKMSFRKIFNK